MNKNFIIYVINIFIINIFFINYVIAANICTYTSKINECVLANRPGSSSGPLSIKNFLCIQSSNKEEIIYQIILDNKFKKVDKDIELYLKNLEDEKGRYFGSNKKESLLLGIEDIYNKFDIFGEYWNRYYDFCYAGNSDSILQKTISCLGGTTTINTSKDFFTQSTCMNLATNKLLIYRKVASDIMKSNKHEARKDDRRKHTYKQKTEYDKIKELFMINLGYLERMLSKMVEKTKNVYH